MPTVVNPVSYQAKNASAKAQMEFQERMSNTAHQREIADLKKAGLNPVLSASSSGASVPEGAEGYVGEENAKLFDLMTQTMNQALESNAKAVSKAVGALKSVAKAKVSSKSSTSESGTGSRTGLPVSSNPAAQSYYLNQLVDEYMQNHADSRSSAVKAFAADMRKSFLGQIPGINSFLFSIESSIDRKQRERVNAAFSRDSRGNIVTASTPTYATADYRSNHVSRVRSSRASR